jgi:hypothetical protein
MDFQNIHMLEAMRILEERHGERELDYGDDPRNMIGFSNPYTHHCKIMVNGVCIGLVGYAYCSEAYNTNVNPVRSIKDYFEMMVLPMVAKGHNKKLDEDSFIKIANKTFYVVYLWLFKEEKAEADLAPTAAIRVVFDKLKELAKSGKCRYILAGGKDQRVTRLYQVAGGFKKITGYPSYSEYREMVPHPMDEDWDGVEGVYEAISESMVYYTL